MSSRPLPPGRSLPKKRSGLPPSSFSKKLAPWSWDLWRYLAVGVGNAFVHALRDLSAAGTLAHAENAALLLRHLSDSNLAGEISAVASADDLFFFPPADDRTLRRWATPGLNARDSIPFPSETVGTTVSRWQGRLVFYRSDGSERYVVLQVDPTSGAAPDFGFVTF